MKSSLTFSLEMLLREEEGLFRFSADGSQKEGRLKKKTHTKKPTPTLCSRNPHIPMTFASQAAKRSTCSVSRLPLLQPAGRKLSSFLGKELSTLVLTQLCSASPPTHLWGLLTTMKRGRG